MQIQTGYRTQRRLPSSPAPVRESSTLDNTEPKEDWLGTSLSLVGGAAAVVGSLTNQPLVTAGGSLVSSLGMGITASKAQARGSMDTAAWVSLVGGGTLVAAAALTTMAPQPAPVQQGPLPTLMRRLNIPV